MTCPVGDTVVVLGETVGDVFRQADVKAGGWIAQNIDKIIQGKGKKTVPPARNGLQIGCGGRI